MALESLRNGNAADMVIALKALGNAGHPGSIKTIMRFLPGVAANPVDLPPRVQSAAVQSLRLIAARDPHSVRAPLWGPYGTNKALREIKNLLLKFHSYILGYITEKTLLSLYLKATKPNLNDEVITYFTVFHIAV